MRRILVTVGVVALISTGVNASGDQTEPLRGSVVEAGPPRTPPTPWPSQLLIATDLREFVELAWNHSPSFRDQCRQLGAARAMVIVRSSQETSRAEARIGRSADGVTVARVSVRRSRDAIEFIAHELEHVLEHLEGVTFLDVKRSGSGISVSGGAFETRRADDAGRRVASEVRAATRAHAGSGR